jgi:hypothetical protein
MSSMSSRPSRGRISSTVTAIERGSSSRTPSARPRGPARRSAWPPARRSAHRPGTAGALRQSGHEQVGQFRHLEPVHGRDRDEVGELQHVLQRDQLLGDPLLGHQVYRTELGEPCDPRNAPQAIKAAAKRAKLPSAAGLQTLRHSAASLMLSASVPLKVVSEVFGHASVAITGDIYGHVSPEGFAGGPGGPAQRRPSGKKVITKGGQT